MEKCKKSDLILEVKSKRISRFKAGSDLSTKVNRVAVEINEESLNDHELIEIRIQLFREECEKSDCPNS